MSLLVIPKADYLGGTGPGDGALRGWDCPGERELLAHGPCVKGDAAGGASRGGAPADLRETLVGPLERVQVRGVVQVERRIGEPDNPPARRGTP